MARRRVKNATPRKAAPLVLSSSATERRSKATSMYDAGVQGRRTAGWKAPTASANSAVLGSLNLLRDRSRAATRNDGYAKSVIDKLVTNIIGTGITPRSQASDPALRKRINALWARWTWQSDADGLLDWEGQTGQAVRTWLEGGECFARIRPRLPEDGLVVPLQVQLLEPELCPHTHNDTSSRIRAGIEFSPVGRRNAYWFHPSRPELDDFDASQLRRVSATSVVHLYDPLRPGQLRGIPHLTPALVELHELAKYRDAQLLRQQLANLFVGFVTKEPGAGTTESLHPLTGLPVETSTDNKPMLTLEPGIFQELGSGEDVKWSDPPDATGYADFMRQQLYGVAAATGVPYEVMTGDMRQVNDRTVRVILNEFRRRIQAYQHQIVVFQLCQPVWTAWFEAAYLSGALELPADYLRNREAYEAVVWNPQAFPYIHPVQDVEAQERRVRAGFTSRAAVVADQGDDIETVDAEQAADNERADGLGLRYDSDGRTTKAAASQGASEPDPSPTPQPEGAAA